MLKNRTIKSRLMIVMAVFSIVFIGLLGFLIHQSSKFIRDGKSAQLVDASENVLDKIDRNLFERYGDVQAFAMSESARSGNADRMTAFINDMMGAYSPIYDLMIVTNLKGKVIAVNTVDKGGKALDTSILLGKDYSEQAWFKAAANDEIKPGTAHIENLHVDADVDAVFKNGGRVMNYTAPIRDKETGKVLGVWTNRMSWDDVVAAIMKEESEKLKNEHISHVFSYLMDTQGQFMFHPEGETHVLKQSLEGFSQVQPKVEQKTLVMEDQLKSESFSGALLGAMARSKGYATYPSQNWYVKVAVPAEDDQTALNMKIFVLALVLSLLVNIFGIQVVRGLGRMLDHVIGQLNHESQRIRQLSTEVNQTSSAVSEASTRQASALQETAASIEEMNAMTKKSSENAGRSQDVAQKSSVAAGRGKSSIDQMVRAIQEIDGSNARIMGQVEESNRQVTDIVKVITEIGNKTKVINDIVFQTKLLSFNASVEAARAGEHGKGFAVVAEEVGNLATMSGNAAKEISDMLSESIQKVETIVKDTKGKVEVLIVEGKEKVAAGSKIASDCASVFDQVVSNIEDVNQMMGEITIAAQEQSQGIGEITKAMNMLDQSTHENASASQQSASSANDLLNQAESLGSIVSELVREVKGPEFVDSIAKSTNPTPKPNLTLVRSSTNVTKLSPHAEPTTAAFAKVSGGSDHVQVPSESDPRFKDL